MNMNEKLFYSGIYGEESIPLIRDTIHVTRFDRVAENYRGDIKPHIHNNLHQIFVVEEGSLILLFNDDRYTAVSKSYLSIPKNTLHGFYIDESTKGWLITLSESVFERLTPLLNSEVHPTDEVHVVQFDLNDLLLADLYNTIHRCVFEFNNVLPEKETALEHLVGLLLVGLHRIPNERKQILKTQDTGYKTYYRRFMQLIREKYAFNTPMDYYATNLSITTGHLNRVCKSISGSSPKALIIDYFIAEAKRTLQQEKRSIAEIAYTLGFDDPGYFTRLFRQKTGQTPKEYRYKSWGRD